jgi:chromate transporter
MRQRPSARAFLSGLTVASLGLMAGVLVELVGTALVDVPTVLIALAALALLLWTGLNSAWLIAGGVAAGLLHAALA